MKKGKTSKLDIFKNAKCSYGTVDSQEFKSLYISIQSWVQPKKEATNWDRVTGNMCREIQHNLLESDESNPKPKSPPAVEKLPN